MEKEARLNRAVAVGAKEGNSETYRPAEQTELKTFTAGNACERQRWESLGQSRGDPGAERKGRTGLRSFRGRMGHPQAEGGAAGPLSHRGEVWAQCKHRDRPSRGIQLPGPRPVTLPRRRY